MVGVAISEGMILIASIIITTGLIGAVMSQLGGFQSSFSATTQANKDITLTKIKTIYVTNSSSTAVTAWIKNIGSTPITNLDRVDIYFGKLGSALRIPYNTGSAPTWTYSTSVTQWGMKDTLQFNISYDSTLQKNTMYVLRVSAPNGVVDEYLFSIL